MKNNIVFYAFLAVLMHAVGLFFIFNVFEFDSEKKEPPKKIMHAKVLDVTKVPGTKAYKEIEQRKQQKIKAEKERQRKIAEEKKRQAEIKKQKELAEKKRLLEEAKKRDAELALKRKQEEEEKKRLEEEKLKAEAEKKRLEEEKLKAEAEKKRVEEEKKRKAEQEKKRIEEEKRKAEEKKRLEEEQKKKALEKAKQEELRKQKEREQKNQAAEDELFEELAHNPKGEGGGTPIDNQAIQYGMMIKNTIEEAWRIDSSMKGKKVVVSLSISADGQIYNPSCKGDTKVCESALRAVNSISFLPKPPASCSDCRSINLTMIPMLR